MSSTSNFEKFTFPKFGEIAPKRFSVEAYHKMAELGIFDEDDRVKAASYASAGIPVYWIVNLKQWQLEVFFSPQGNEYTKRVLLEPHDDAIVGSGFSARTAINVGDLIPDSAAAEPPNAA